jgi:hypothetical protein
MAMLYCPYTHTSPPKCFTSEVLEVSERVKKLIREALKDPKHESCVVASDQAMLSCDFCVKVLSEDEYSIKVSLETCICSAGCWEYSVTAVIPKTLIE